MPIEVTLSPIVMLVRLVQYANDSAPIDEVTLSGMVTMDRLLHPMKARFPIDITLSGMVTMDRLLHSMKARFPIDITLSGIVTLVRLVQLCNALLPIEVTGKPL